MQLTGHSKRAKSRYVLLYYSWLKTAETEGVILQVGDFGELDKHSGEFVYRGNIYKDETIVSQIPELVEESYQPKRGERIDDWVIFARTAQQSDAALSPQALVPISTTRSSLLNTSSCYQ